MLAAQQPEGPVDEQSSVSRYVVGIDLGTTNSAVSFVDTADSSWRIRSFLIPQLTAPGTIESLEVLPSFHYEALPEERQAGGLRLPWMEREPKYAVGAWARDEGGRVPGRLIHSAKSWLCHSGIDRRAAILPWHAAADVERLSPIDVSARFLDHIRLAWNATHRDEPLEKQEIILTLPASFDEVARELTVEAARQAGLPRIALIEEPQAAFYAWVYKHHEHWQDLVHPGQTVLVCDIGGGTTDFTLIRVRGARSAADGPAVQFHRVAVGEHLLLGGDNLDVYLARWIEEQKLAQGPLEPRQWETLVRQARRAKELLLSDDAPTEWTLHLGSSGSRLIAGALRIRLQRDEVRHLLQEGFLPAVGFDERPQRRRVGFQEFGLPYAPDPAITRYLAEFLYLHRQVGRDSPLGDDLLEARPDVLLFNGGFFNAMCLQQRLLEVIRSWFAACDPNWRPLVLAHDKLHLAVANGAAYYGMVRRGQGIRIAAGLARSYYVGVAAERPVAVCLIPGNAQPGSHYRLEQPTFDVAVGYPVEFPLFVSSTRLVDPPGSMVEIVEEQLRPLPSIRTVLQTGRRTHTGTVPVTLEAQLTEIGTIELYCRQTGRDRSWRLQFDARSAVQTDKAQQTTRGELSGLIDEQVVLECCQVVHEVFGSDGTAKPAELMMRLSKVIGAPRDQWPSTLLRRLWEQLMADEPGRRKSAAHEARWLNLLGFALRPGYGLAVDDWRVGQTWRTVYGHLAYQGASRNEALILWRRIAGGLSAGQQRALIDALLPTLRKAHRKEHRASQRSESLDPVQVWYTAGSLEWISPQLKWELAQRLMDLLNQEIEHALFVAWVWALGRLIQRVPSYGPLNTLLDPEHVAPCLLSLMKLDGRQRFVQLAVALGARRTGDRYRDVGEPLRKDVVRWLEIHQAAPHLVTLVREGGQLDSQEEHEVFGESLPLGLRLCQDLT